jgi:hypothetical protein
MAKDAAGGGVTITGSNVSTGGGDIVGRDKIEHLSPQIDDVFGPIGKVIETAGGAFCDNRRDRAGHKSYKIR